MTQAGFLWKGVDLGLAPTNLLLVDKQVQLVPDPHRRIVDAGARPGTWDFGTEFGEREIQLELVTGDNASLAGSEVALRAIADAFDPTTEAVVGDKAVGQLIFDSESDRYWLAKLVNGPMPEYLPTAGRMRLTMRCSDPFAYSTAQYVISGGGAMLTGFSAYRQAPEKIGWNLVKNGGLSLAIGSEWSLPANASRAPDATSPTGWAIRLLSTAFGQTSAQDFTVEAGKAYSFASRVRSDGVAGAYMSVMWFDANSVLLAGGGNFGNITSAAYTEVAATNQIAPGNARTARVGFFLDAAGIGFATAFRCMQQSTAAPAWVAAHQQTLTQKGLSIQEATTNLVPADADMELVGVASWGAVTATLTKDTTNPFAGTKRLKVVNTAANGFAYQAGALATGQPVTASVLCIGADAGAGLDLYSTPSMALIGQDRAVSADWAVRRVSGVIAGGDTGWQARLQGGTGAAVTSYFDNFGVENKAYDTINADPSGLAFTLASRTASTVRLPLPAGLDLTDFAIVGTYRPDHAYNRGAPDRQLLVLYLDGNNYHALQLIGTGRLRYRRLRAGVIALLDDAIATAPAAGDTIAWAIRCSTAAGMKLWISKNGAAVVSYTLASAEALIALSGLTSLAIGELGFATGFEQDGTTGVIRIIKAGQTDATIAALVANPYQAQDETYELAVWRFEGSAAPEDFASTTLSLEVGGTYWVDPTIELTAGGAYTGNIVFTDSFGNVLTWNGTVALNDVLKVESDTLRVRKNSVLSMSGVVAGSKWPRFRGGGLRDSIVVGGISAANIKALTATYRTRWL